MANETNAPESTEREGGISLAVFPAKDGKAYKGLVLQKSYKKKDEEEWTRQNINLFFGELVKVKEVVDRTCEKYAEEVQKAKEYATKKTQESTQ